MTPPHGGNGQSWDESIPGYPNSTPSTAHCLIR